MTKEIGMTACFENRRFDLDAKLTIWGNIRAGGFITDITLASLRERSGDSIIEQPTENMPDDLYEAIHQAIADRLLIQEIGETYL